MKIIGKRPKNYLRLFVVECSGPIDTMEGRSESAGIAALAKLIGHAVLSFQTHSLNALREHCAYIGSMCDVANEDLTKPLCLHISAHGGTDGLLFGGNHVDWTTLLKAIQPVLTHKYEGNRILVLSACYANQKELANAIAAAVRADSKLKPPHYIFCATDEVSWPNAAVGWTLLYHLIPNVNLNDKNQVQKMLTKIKSVDAPSFAYFRWDEQTRRYLQWTQQLTPSSSR
jgi:hypothetical protein